MIKEVVGAKVYNVWLDMLKYLVPNGRTHRLSAMVGGMFQYSLEIAKKKEASNTNAKKLIEIFESVFDYYDENDLDPIVEIAEKLFEDADVNSERTNRRGDYYSIAEEAVREFLNWENMPWDS